MIERAEGRRLFGFDPEAYDRVRPRYPEWIFTDLEQAGALGPGTVTLEIGPGSGLATRALLERGADPVTLVEPDERFAGMLNQIAGRYRASCTIVHRTFEDAPLNDGSFDLVTAATAFHWLEPGAGFARARRLLKPGGTLALLWNVLQIPGRPDAFHDATRELLAPLAASPSGAPEALPYALDRAAREAEATAAGFHTVAYRESRWTITLDPGQTVSLYEGFSSVQRLPAEDRAQLLRRLEAIAIDRFGGRVERNVTSCLYRIT